MRAKNTLFARFEGFCQAVRPNNAIFDLDQHLFNMSIVNNVINIKYTP